MEKKYNQWYWKVYRWWKWEAKHFHRDVIKGIKNLWKWFPIVWKDRDWDDSYIFDALKFKLKNTADYFEKTNSFAGWEDEVKYIRICERLIDKITNMVPNELIGNLGDTHLYLNHIEPIKEQLTREPFELPKLVNMKTNEFWKEFDMGLIGHLDHKDFTLENYQSHPTIKLPLSS